MALIYFLTSDHAAARKEALEAGWTQIAMTRWAWGRDDIRVVTSAREFMRMPGGAYFLPASDLAGVDSSENPEPWEFKKLVAAGLAQWVGNPLLGEEDTKKLIDGIKEPKVKADD